ncbi:MAG: hypothetical protein L0Y80_06955 [Ignavibacteriae bacterium]|nr:hypothetical protein [Ignavibacteriota bacterium]
MQTPQNNNTPPAKKHRPRSLARKHRNIAEYLTHDDIPAALDLFRRRISGGSTRAARYVLDLYFGKPAAGKPAPPSAPSAPNVRLTDDFLNQLSEKYFPKPKA